MKSMRAIAVTFLLLVVVASAADAEVKQVRMKIAGYLCGN